MARVKSDNKKEIVKVLEYAANILFGIIFITGLFFFVYVNNAVFKNGTVAYVCVGAIALIFAACVLFFGKRAKIKRIFIIISNLLCCALFIYICVEYLAIDYFQPLKLSTVSTVLLIIGITGLIVTGILSTVLKPITDMSTPIAILIIITMLVGIVWGNTQAYKNFSDERIQNKQFIFQNGEQGYSTFRIPSLIAIDKNSVNEKYNLNLKNDILLATAEGRKNSSKDVGCVDLVGKVSADKGKSWSELQVLFSLGDEVGKVGNPTPVYDTATGILNMVFLSATKSSGFDYRSYNVQGKLNKDLNFSFGSPILLNTDIDKLSSTNSSDGVNDNTIMVGPGKSLQLKNGRLIIPCSNKGEAFVLYSDDHGKTWLKGASAGTGNECEAAQLENGEIVMVVRDNIGCSTFHPQQYQRLSFSKDGGKTWYIKNKQTQLKTPVCMASLATDKNNSLIMTYPNCFLTRACLSLAISDNNADTWSVYTLYDGASGYSCVESDSDNNIFVLAEVGKVNYNEALVFIQLVNR